MCVLIRSRVHVNYVKDGRVCFLHVRALRVRIPIKLYYVKKNKHHSPSSFPASLWTKASSAVRVKTARARE